jgi:hypothetical protein
MLRDLVCSIRRGRLLLYRTEHRLKDGRGVRWTGHEEEVGVK